MRVTARLATEADAAQLEQLAIEAVEEKLSQRGGPLWSLIDMPAESIGQRIIGAIGSPSQVAVVGEIDDAVVGFAFASLVTASDDGPLIADLAAIHVEESARGVGVGEALMNFVLQWARDHECGGVDSTALPGDRDTKNFFESFGLVARAIRVHRSL